MRRKKILGFAAVILIVNLIAILIMGVRKVSVINRRMDARAQETGREFASVMENYKHSFRLFVELMDNCQRRADNRGRQCPGTQHSAAISGGRPLYNIQVTS